MLSLRWEATHGDHFFVKFVVWDLLLSYLPCQQAKLMWKNSVDIMVFTLWFSFQRCPHGNSESVECCVPFECLDLHLKTLKVAYYQEALHASFVKFFVLNARVLESINLVVDRKECAANGSPDNIQSFSWRTKLLRMSELIFILIQECIISCTRNTFMIWIWMTPMICHHADVTMMMFHFEVL